MAVECDRWNWRELLASEDSHLPPTTRLVLLTLSLHMNEHGANAWPSQELLAKRTGLSERAVREHLAIAEKQDWIQITQRRRRGQAWFSHQYFPMIPDALAERVKAAHWESDPKWQRPERGSARSPERPANDARHPEPGSSTPGTSFLNTRNHVPPNSSYNDPLNQSKERLLTQTDSGFCEGSKTEEPESGGIGADDKTRRRTGVHSKVNRHAKPAPRFRSTDEMEAEAIEHHIRDGLTDDQIARKLEVVPVERIRAKRREVEERQGAGRKSHDTKSHDTRPGYGRARCRRRSQQFRF